jgi:hypothetical protein
MHLTRLGLKEEKGQALYRLGGGLFWAEFGSPIQAWWVKVRTHRSNLLKTGSVWIKYETESALLGLA